MDLLEQSPSLQNDFAILFSKCWAEALASVKEDYPQTEFPNEWALSNEIDAQLSKRFW
ncbi:DUF29 family protein [Gloeocapsopsis crepidinum]|uniref:DUF29 family protein n=1 Tax=Gloeocapsopsis crepidinum TaxID=693223 RepID=UPI003898EE2C